MPAIPHIARSLTGRISKSIGVSKAAMLGATKTGIRLLYELRQDMVSGVWRLT